jgi:hypothetical protein
VTSSSGSRPPRVVLVGGGEVDEPVELAVVDERRVEQQLVVVVLVVVLRLDLVERHAGLGRPAGLLLDVDLVGQRGEEGVLPALEQLLHGVAALEDAARSGVPGCSRAACRALTAPGGRSSSGSAEETVWTTPRESRNIGHPMQEGSGRPAVGPTP